MRCVHSQMEFPQRVLKLSADSVREAEKWHAALHNAMGGLSSPARQPVASLVAGVREAGSPVEGRASPQQGADHRKPQVRQAPAIHAARGARRLLARRALHTALPASPLPPTRARAHAPARSATSTS